MAERNAQLGFSFVCPDKDLKRVYKSLGKLPLEDSAISRDGSGYPVITGRCAQEQDRVITETIFRIGQQQLDEGDASLLRLATVTFEDLSKRELLEGGGITTIIHQIAIRSLIQGIEED